jgi:CDP-diacylglycerol--glycerol-3-phosphate 3-phosphatidyltransferase
LITFITIIISDVLDGFLARKLECTSSIGAKLDIISDTFYTISSLIVFAHFEIIPVWFVFIVILKLFEFIITSKIIGRKQKLVIFDKIGKISISIVMILPGIFVFRCIIIDYKAIMSIIIFMVTAMLIISSVNRIINAIRYVKT